MYGSLGDAVSRGDEDEARRLLLEIESDPIGGSPEELIHILLANTTAHLVPPILHALLSIAAARGVHSTTSEEIAQLCRSVLDHDSAAARSLALEGLGEFGAEGDVDRMMKFLEDSDSLVRVSTLDAIATLSPARARGFLPGLIEREKDPWAHAAVAAHAFLACVTDKLPDPNELLNQGFDVAGAFVRAAGEFLNSSLPEEKRAKLQEFAILLMRLEPDEFVRESVEALLHELADDSAT